MARVYRRVQFPLAPVLGSFDQGLHRLLATEAGEEQD